ncbi:DedA family protein [Patescibacteria group bacterium]|nr:MAG: DedA family protein [Patescibacteria group bacterium]
MAAGIDKLILGGGLIAIGATVFAESGLLIGFFLPGDTLLFGAGILASQGTFPLHWLLLIVIVSAIVGDNVGYSIGKRTGKRIFKKEEGILFRHEHIERAEAFYEAHGGKTIIIARFIPIVRTFAPLVAGIGRMDHRRFTFFNAIGATIWGGGVILLGYWFGTKVPWVEQFITPILLIVILLSISGSLIHVFREPQSRKLLIEKLRRGRKHVQSRLSRR